MAKEPENSSEKPNFLISALTKYGRYLYLPGGLVPDPSIIGLNTITIWERLELIAQEEKPTTEKSLPKPQPDNSSEAWMLRRIEPKAPIDFMEYQKRRN